MEIVYDLTQLNQEIGKLTSLRADQPEGSKMLREMAITVCGSMVKRIHERGQASDGSQIGTYSPGYMRFRTGQYATNQRFSKGKRKGEIKESGVYTKGKNKGQKRYQWNKTADPKVILELSGYMRIDFGIGETNPIDLKDQGIGLGFTMPAKAEPGETKAISNNEKRIYLEELYGKKIYDPTKEEIAEAVAVADKYVSNLLK